MTGDIKEANAGGITSQKLANLGIKAVIAEGKPADQGWFLLKITPDGAELLDAGDLAGRGMYEVTAFCRERYGSKVGVITIGLAGEMCLFGCIFPGRLKNPAES